MGECRQKAAESSGHWQGVPVEARLDDMTALQSMTLSRVSLAPASQRPSEGGSDVTAGRLQMPGKSPLPRPLR